MKVGVCRMKQQGKVTSIHNGYANIQVLRASACGDKCSGCSGGCSKEVIDVNVRNDIHSKIGDNVELEVDEKTIIGAALLVYIFPIVSLILGLILTAVVTGWIGIRVSEIALLSGGMSFMFFSFLVIRKIDKRINANNSITFHMTRIL